MARIWKPPLASPVRRDPGKGFLITSSTSSLDDVQLGRMTVKPGAEVATMHFRIDQLHEGANQVVLRMSGRIEEQALDPIRQLLDRAKGKMAVDLKEVSLVGREAVTFRAFCENRGVELRNCPAYVRERIDRERPSD